MNHIKSYYTISKSLYKQSNTPHKLVSSLSSFKELPNLFRNYCTIKTRKRMKPNYRITMDPIGLFESVFLNKTGTPRQGKIAPTSKGKIKIDCKHGYDAVKGLDSFSHVWVIFWFHNNDAIWMKEQLERVKNNQLKNKLNNENGSESNEDIDNSDISDINNFNENLIEIRSTKEERNPPKHVTVRPPRLDGKRTGVFSTRSPHRYNDIGLTLCKLDSIEQDTLYLSGVDIIDGTPILDIKPYIPYCDSEPNATVPKWVENQKTAVEDVEFTENAIETMNNCLETFGLDLLKLEDKHLNKDQQQQLQTQLQSNTNNTFIPEMDKKEERLERLKKVITEVLKSEVRSTYRRKCKPDEEWGFFCDTLNVQCKMLKSGTITVYNVEDKDEFIKRKEELEKLKQQQQELEHQQKLQHQQQLEELKQQQRLKQQLKQQQKIKNQLQFKNQLRGNQVQEEIQQDQDQLNQLFQDQEDENKNKIYNK